MTAGAQHPNETILAFDVFFHYEQLTTRLWTVYLDFAWAFNTLTTIFCSSIRKARTILQRNEAATLATKPNINELNCYQV